MARVDRVGGRAAYRRADRQCRTILSQGRSAAKPAADGAVFRPIPGPVAAGVTSYVTLIDQRSDQLALEGEADLIFIDGDHTYEGCLADVRRLVPNNLRPGGYLVLHDYYGWYDASRKSASPVRAVIEQLIAEGQLEHILIDTGYMSFVIFRRPDPKAEQSLAK